MFSRTTVNPAYRKWRPSAVQVPSSLVPACSRVWLFCDPMDCSPPGSSVHGISQARILEWVAISFSRESSQPRNWTHVSYIGRQILDHCAIWEAHKYCWLSLNPCISQHFDERTLFLRPSLVHLRKYISLMINLLVLITVLFLQTWSLWIYSFNYNHQIWISKSHSAGTVSEYRLQLTK